MSPVAKMLVLFGEADHIIAESDRNMIADALAVNDIDHDVISYPDTPTVSFSWDATHTVPSRLQTHGRE